MAREGVVRILSGPAQPDAHFRVHAALAAVREHEILRFGADASVAEIPYRAGADRWEDVLARLPPGWQPDLVLFWDPYYHPLPLGFERSPCPTAALFMDWFFWPQRAGLCAGFFDALFTNPTGARFLRAAGLPVAGETNYLGVDWERFAADPAAPRDLDVCMVTSLDHFFRPRRARHLERLARLAAAGLRLHVTNDAYGAAYPALLARAKVAFNDSDFAILNSRTFEGMAAGAAVMEEASNPEVQVLFTDGVDLAFYGEEDLEERLRALLADDAARIALARRGQERARAFSYEARVAAAVATVAAAVGQMRPEQRPATAWPAARVQGASAVLALSALVAPQDLGPWQRAYVELPIEEVDDVPLLCALAWVGMRVAQRGECRLLPLAARALTRALALDEGDPVARFNAGRLHELTAQHARAQQVWQLLADESPQPPHPARHGWYVDELLVRDLLGGWLAAPAAADVLRQAALGAIARLHHAQGDLAAARRAYRAAEAVAEGTNLAAAAARLRATLAEEQGDLDEAAAALRVACARSGMHVEAWREYAAVLHARGAFAECQQWCAERAAMLAGFPPYAEVRAELAALGARCAEAAPAEAGVVSAGALVDTSGTAMAVQGHGLPADAGHALAQLQPRPEEAKVTTSMSQAERWLAEARELFAAGRRFDCLHRCIEKLRVLETIPDLAPAEVVQAFRQLRTQCYPGISNPLVAEFIPAATRSLLDVGCGYGELGGFLKEGAPERFVCGIDIDPNRAAVARERLDLVVLADLDAMPGFPQRPGGFDCVAFADVLEHLKRPEAALRAAAEVLAPGGCVVISVPNARHWHLLAPLVVEGEWRYVDAGILDRTHLRFFTLRSLERLIEEAGFVVDGGISALTIPPSFDATPLARAVAELGGDAEEFRRHLGLFQFCLRARPRR